jgi:hypothetical protein
MREKLIIAANIPSERRVDINILLAKVRTKEKKEKIETTIFISMVAMAIIVTGVIVSL